MTTPWTPGFTDSDASTSSPGERYLLQQRLPTFRDIVDLRTPAPSPRSVLSSLAATSSPQREPPSSAEPIAQRTRTSASWVPHPSTAELLRRNDGTTHYTLLRRATSTPSPPTSISDISVTSNESEDSLFLPSSPCPSHADIGSRDLLDLARAAELERNSP